MGLLLMTLCWFAFTVITDSFVTSTGFCKHHANLTTERVAQHQRNLIHSTLCLHAPICLMPVISKHLGVCWSRTKWTRGRKKKAPEPDDGQWGPNESSQNHCTYPSVKQSISFLTSLWSSIGGRWNNLWKYVCILCNFKCPWRSPDVPH